MISIVLNEICKGYSQINRGGVWRCIAQNTGYSVLVHVRTTLSMSKLVSTLCKRRTCKGTEPPAEPHLTGQLYTWYCITVALDQRTCSLSLPRACRLYVRCAQQCSERGITWLSRVQLVRQKSACDRYCRCYQCRLV